MRAWRGTEKLGVPFDMEYAVATMGADPTPTSGSALLSLVELRRQLLRRSSALSVRAKLLRARGDVLAASRAADDAARLKRIAREMAAAAKPYVGDQPVG